MIRLHRIVSVAGCAVVVSAIGIAWWSLPSPIKRPTERELVALDFSPEVASECYSRKQLGYNGRWITNNWAPDASGQCVNSGKIQTFQVNLRPDDIIEGCTVYSNSPAPGLTFSGCNIYAGQKTGSAIFIIKEKTMVPLGDGVIVVPNEYAP